MMGDERRRHRWANIENITHPDNPDEFAAELLRYADKSAAAIRRMPGERFHEAVALAELVERGVLARIRAFNERVIDQWQDAPAEVGEAEIGQLVAAMLCGDLANGLKYGDKTTRHIFDLILDGNRLGDVIDEEIVDAAGTKVGRLVLERYGRSEDLLEGLQVQEDRLPDNRDWPPGDWPPEDWPQE